MLMYRTLYPNWYKSRSYLSQYKGDEDGNHEMLVTVAKEIES